MVVLPQAHLETLALVAVEGLALLDLMGLVPLVVMVAMGLPTLTQDQAFNGPLAVAGVLAAVRLALVALAAVEMQPIVVLRLVLVPQTQDQVAVEGDGLAHHLPVMAATAAAVS